MQARRAARELAFILFSQFDKKITNYSKENLDDIIIKSVRILSGSANDELRILAELREKAIRDEKSLKEGYYNDGKIDGLKQGRVEGIIQNNKKIAKKLKQKGLDIDFIIEITNLTKEEIEKL